MREAYGASNVLKGKSWSPGIFLILAKAWKNRLRVSVSVNGHRNIRIRPTSLRDCVKEAVWHYAPRESAESHNVRS